VARYRHRDGWREWTTEKQVLAFDDNGEALVLTDDGLEPAHRQPGRFLGIMEPDTTFRTIITSGGWRARVTLHDGSAYVVPLVAWAIDDHGWGVPIITDADGGAQPLQPKDYARVELEHPDEQYTPPPAAAVA
jgi:hypothetical protein